MNSGLFTSNTAEWGTPQALFDELNEEFQFDLDPCSTHENAKCDLHYTKAEDGLQQDWTGHRVYCNPPYGREIGKWVKKAHDSDCLTVMLLPARTDTQWFHKYIYGAGGVSIRFLPGRLYFNDGNGRAPFPSMVVIFEDGRAHEEPVTLHDSYRSRNIHQR